jgi:hypothetical protein
VREVYVFLLSMMSGTSGTHGISSFDLSQASFPKMWEPSENSVGPALRVNGIKGINTFIYE